MATDIKKLLSDAKKLGLYLNEVLEEEISSKTKVKWSDKNGYLYSFSRENITVSLRRNGVPCTFFNKNPYTFENINNYFKTHGIHLELVTTKPKSAICDLEFKCLKHDVTFVRSWNGVKNGTTNCRKCEGSNVHQYTIELAKEVISERRCCKLISNEWFSNKHEYKFRCACGNVFTRIFSVVLDQGNDKCRECSGVSIHTTDSVKNDLFNHGIELLSEYKNIGMKIKIKYPCGFIVNRTYAGIKQSKYECPHCNLPGYAMNTKKFTDIVEDVTDSEYTVVGEYTIATNRIDFLHRSCGNTFNTTPRNFIKKNTRCPYCSDGCSYPEKFMMSILDQLNINFIHDTTFKWSNSRRYDFYIPSLNMIIETHGRQHYDGSFSKFGGRTLEDEEENDRYKEQLALKNGFCVSDYVVINCRVSDINHVKNSVISSCLNEVLDLSKVDFNIAHKTALKSKCIVACSMYTNGSTVEKIAYELNVSTWTVKNYLKKGSKIDICSY